MKKIPLPPEATQLLESLRSIGYSAEAAVADLIDNSITADASAVEIRFPAGPPVHVAIIDDGKGMSADELIQACVTAPAPLPKPGPPMISAVCHLSA